MELESYGTSIKGNRDNYSGTEGVDCINSNYLLGKDVEWVELTIFTGLA